MAIQMLIDSGDVRDFRPSYFASSSKSELCRIYSGLEYEGKRSRKTICSPEEDLGCRSFLFQLWGGGEIREIDGRGWYFWAILY
jgi:hypothetical protein